MDFLGHFKTVNEHRKAVRTGCFKVGLFYQGITHDLSKYSPTEFLVGLKYYQGYRSPNNAEREEKGYSEAWLHHKGRNKHHYEYWLDYSSRTKGITPVKMPVRYLVEMYMDRIAASKTYNGEKYDDSFPLKYYQMGKDLNLIEESTRRELEKLLTMLSDHGEAYVEAYIRKNLLKNNPGTLLIETVEKIKNIRQKRKKY